MYGTNDSAAFALALAGASAKFKFMGQANPNYPIGGGQPIVNVPIGSNTGNYVLGSTLAIPQGCGDRNAGALLGTWQGRPDEPPYLVPQEFGLRTDCRWFEFIDEAAGRVLRLDVLAPRALHVSATHFTADDLYRARTETELQPRAELVVHADVAHRGLGTASCGPDALPQYRLQPGTYRFSYRLALFAAE